MRIILSEESRWELVEFLNAGKYGSAVKELLEAKIPMSVVMHSWDGIAHEVSQEQIDKLIDTMVAVLKDELIGRDTTIDNLHSHLDASYKKVKFLEGENTKLSRALSDVVREGVSPLAHIGMHPYFPLPQNVFSFKCPACGKEHQYSNSFLDGDRTFECVHCETNYEFVPNTELVREVE